MYSSGSGSSSSSAMAETHPGYHSHAIGGQRNFQPVGYSTTDQTGQYQFQQPQEAIQQQQQAFQMPQQAPVALSELSQSIQIQNQPFQHQYFHPQQQQQQQHLQQQQQQQQQQQYYDQYHRGGPSMSIPTGQNTPSIAVNPAIQFPSMVNAISVTSASLGQTPPPGIKPRVTTTLWEDEGTLCFQVETKGICVARREDNNMINGTKLLNVTGMTRGRRDGILKSEKVRHVVKIGTMYLKGVWIPYERALEFSARERIVDQLYPLFVADIKSFLYHPLNYTRTVQVLAAAERKKQVDLMRVQQAQNQAQNQQAYLTAQQHQQQSHQQQSHQQQSHQQQSHQQQLQQHQSPQQQTQQMQWPTALPAPNSNPTSESKLDTSGMHHNLQHLGEQPLPSLQHQRLVNFDQYQSLPQSHQQHQQLQPQVLPQPSLISQSMSQVQPGPSGQQAFQHAQISTTAQTDSNRDDISHTQQELPQISHQVDPSEPNQQGQISYYRRQHHEWPTSDPVQVTTPPGYGVEHMAKADQSPLNIVRHPATPET